MASRGEDIASVLKRQIQEFSGEITMSEVGVVIGVGDGIARIHGLAGCRYNELLQFPNDIIGLALNLEEDSISAVLLGDDSLIKEGDQVKATGRIVEVPVGVGLLGRVVDPLGRPLDGKGPVQSTGQRPVEKVAPNVVTRKSVSTPVQTGIKSIDGMIPIGRGQRELIIGDRSTGKTAIAIDTIINQKDGDLVCIYVAIGQKVGKVAQIKTVLEESGALDHTIIVAANASDPAPLQFLAPYSGCAIGEEFMDNGKDALIIYDDLTKHAWAYRQMSLLLRRPPGREAYPGDVFYLHSRLLERAARLNEEAGGGSITALPIIETQAGDVSAYVPTNVISITDGQLYLEPDLFNSGIRPAVNSGLSVTRVGSAAQLKGMKSVAGSLKSEMAQYASLATFAQFGTDDLDAVTRRQLDRGARLTELLKQNENSPLSFESQVAVIYVANEGALDDVPVEKVRDFEAQWHEYVAANLPEVLKSIAETGDLGEDDKGKLDDAVAAFKQTVSI